MFFFIPPPLLLILLLLLSLSRTKKNTGVAKIKCFNLFPSEKEKML